MDSYPLVSLVSSLTTSSDGGTSLLKEIVNAHPDLALAITWFRDLDGCFSPAAPPPVACAIATLLFGRVRPAHVPPTSFSKAK